MRATALLLSLTLLSPALASPENHERLEARKAFAKGRTLFEQGDFRAAMRLFQRANRFEPSPVLSYNIARAAEELGWAGMAIEHYRIYLRETPAAEDRDEVERRVRTTARILEVEQSRAKAPQPLKPWAYLALGVASASTVAAIVFYSDAADLDAERRDATGEPERRALRDASESAEVRGAVFLSLGALGAAAGGALLLLEAHPDYVLGPGPTGTSGFALSGRF